MTEAPRFDITDAIVIPATPREVYDAIVAEMAGETRWWHPDIHLIPMTEGPADAPGAQTWFKVRGRRPRMLSEIVAARPGAFIRTTSVAGDFVGSSEFRFTAHGGGTLLTFRWRMDPESRLFRVLSNILPLRPMHSKVIQAGFRRLKERLVQGQ